jgi:translation initiation factor IF-3
VNERIRVREIRVIDDTGAQLGIMPPPQALAIAKQKSLDLVEISPTANPPVCRIMNFGKFIYQQKKKQQDSKKKQKTTQVKEVKFRPNIDDHDYDFKMKNILKFLSHGDKVKATVQFRGREMARRENGQRVLDRLLKDLSGKAVAESRSEMLGNRLYQILSPVKHEKHEKAPAPAKTGT